MKRTLVPNSCRSEPMRSSTSASTVASRPVVGSSRMRSVGFFASAIAMTTRCCIPPGELVRVAAHDSLRVGDLHFVQHLLAAVQRLLLRDAEELEDLGELRPDSDGRVQGRGRVLVDHRERGGVEPTHVPATHAQHVLAVQANRAALDLRVAREVAHDREGGRRLPAARLPDEPVRLSLPDLEKRRRAARRLSTPRTVYAICRSWSSMAASVISRRAARRHRRSG